MTDIPTVACACHGHEQCAPHDPTHRRARAVRTDAVANVAVIGAAGLIASIGSALDPAVAGVIALILVTGADKAVASARPKLRPAT